MSYSIIMFFLILKINMLNVRHHLTIARCFVMTQNCFKGFFSKLVLDGILPQFLDFCQDFLIQDYLLEPVGDGNKLREALFFSAVFELGLGSSKRFKLLFISSQSWWIKAESFKRNFMFHKCISWNWWLFSYYSSQLKEMHFPGAPFTNMD